MMKHTIHGKTRTARRKALGEIYDNNIPRLTSIEESNEIYAIRSILDLNSQLFQIKAPHPWLPSPSPRPCRAPPPLTWRPQDLNLSGSDWSGRPLRRREVKIGSYILNISHRIQYPLHTISAKLLLLIAQASANIQIFWHLGGETCFRKFRGETRFLEFRGETWF